MFIYRKSVSHNKRTSHTRCKSKFTKSRFKFCFRRNTRQSVHNICRRLRSKIIVILEQRSLGTFNETHSGELVQWIMFTYRLFNPRFNRFYQGARIYDWWDIFIVRRNNVSTKKRISYSRKAIGCTLLHFSLHIFPDGFSIARWHFLDTNIKNIVGRYTYLHRYRYYSTSVIIELSMSRWIII